jgi:hypothetical protein
MKEDTPNSCYQKMAKMLQVGPHVLNIFLKRIKFACEETEDYEHVAQRADYILSREFDEDIFDPVIIEDIRYSLEMIVLFAYSESTQNIMLYVGHIRHILDSIFKPYLMVAQRMYKSICLETTDIGSMMDLPEGVRYKIMNTIYDAL